MPPVPINTRPARLWVDLLGKSLPGVCMRWHHPALCNNLDVLIEIGAHVPFLDLIHIFIGFSSGSFLGQPFPSMSSVEFGKLLIGAGGIYVCFLSYGSLQEDVTSYVAPSGDRFVYPWFLQVLEAFMNIIFGGLLAVVWEGGPRRVPQKEYAISGAVQVTAKYCTTAAMIAGVSFPVATLAKSSKMIPVMVGSLLLGNAKYSLREYVHVFLIVLGTVLVGLAKKSKPGAPSSLWGILFLVGSLVCDGVVGGEQRKLKAKMQSVGLKERNFEMQFYTNFYMGITALGFAVALQVQPSPTLPVVCT